MGEKGIPDHNFPCLALEFSIDLAGPLLQITETDKTSLVCDMVVVEIRSKSVTVNVTNLDGS